MDKNIITNENLKNININGDKRIYNYSINQGYHERERRQRQRNPLLDKNVQNIGKRPNSNDNQINLRKYENQIVYDKYKNQDDFLSNKDISRIKNIQNKMDFYNNRHLSEEKIIHKHNNNREYQNDYKKDRDLINNIINSNEDDNQNLSKNNYYLKNEQNNRKPQNMNNNFRNDNRKPNIRGNFNNRKEIINYGRVNIENSEKDNLNINFNNNKDSNPIKIKNFEEFNKIRIPKESNNIPIKKEINNNNNYLKYDNEKKQNEKHKEESKYISQDINGQNLLKMNNDSLSKDRHFIYNEYQKEKKTNILPSNMLNDKIKKRALSEDKQYNNHNRAIINNYLINNQHEEQNTRKILDYMDNNDNIERINRFKRRNDNENKENNLNKIYNEPKKNDYNSFLKSNKNNLNQNQQKNENGVNSLNTKVVLKENNFQNNNNQYIYNNNSDTTKKIIQPLLDKQKNNQNNQKFNNNILNNNIMDNNRNMNNMNNNIMNQNMKQQNNFNFHNQNNNINGNNMRREWSPLPNNRMNINNQFNNANNNINNNNNMHHQRGLSAQNMVHNNNIWNNNNAFNNNNFIINNNFNQNNFRQNAIQNIRQVQQFNNMGIQQFNNNNLIPNNRPVFNNNFAQFAQFNNNPQNFNINNNLKNSPQIKNNNGLIQNNNNFNNNFGMNINPNLIMIQNPNKGFNQNIFNINQFQKMNLNQGNPVGMQMQNNQQKVIRINSSPHFGFSIRLSHANGLQNIGATCYMNATLQCLAHVKKFTQYLLNNKPNIEKNRYRNKLSYSFTEVLYNIWVTNHFTYYAPYNFKNLISQMNPLFAGVQANDSKDLVLFILETMHNELNTAKKGNQNNSEIIDQCNFENSLQSFIKYFKENFRSIVSDIFYGMYNSRMQCHNCRVITHNIQCFNILIMPLDEVRKFKNRDQNYVSIIECFEYYQKSDYMIGENQIYCNYCKRMSTSENNTSLIIGPKILILNLNRGKGLQFNIKIIFDEYINISPFIYFKQTNVNYRLIGVVSHFGPSGESGHFIAFCKSFVDGNWYRYNDAIVTLSSINEAKNTGVPYILFYEAVYKENKKSK